MNLTTLRFQNYKAFSGREAVEIRPLTVLIGKNSSGKSAIARLPLLLARAFSGRAEAPIELEVEGVDFGASFLDLIHNRRPHGSIQLGASFEGDEFRIEVDAEIQNFDELKMQVVERFEVRASDGTICRLSWAGTDPQEAPARYVLSTEAGQPVRVVASFNNGLFPTRPAPDASDPSEAGRVDVLDRIIFLRLLIAGALGKIGYLGPFRRTAQRTYRYPGGLPDQVGLGGVNAPALLGADALRKGGAVVRAVGEWYAKHLGGWPLDVDPQGDTFALVLRSPDDPLVTVNLADVGTGVAQVLPVIVQRIFERATGRRVGLEIVEQPELHLHPAAHGDLADLYIEAARDGQARFLIETHSENFVLRIRRRIAEGLLAPDQVRIYWIDDTARPGSRIEPIEVLPSGDVTSWPKGVFSEDFEELKHLRRAQQRQAR